MPQCAVELCKSINKEVEESYNIVAKDLEELEQYREIMGTPIQEIRKNLKILEIIKANMTIDDWENVRAESNDDWNKVRVWLEK